MASITNKIAVLASDVPATTKPSNYPPEFSAVVKGRIKQQLGEWFGLSNLGINLTTLEPFAASALQHCHSRQDEFIYVLEGAITLIVGDDELLLEPGMCAGFKAGGRSHHLENRGSEPARYLEIGDRTPDDTVTYPDCDLVRRSHDGVGRFEHRDGTPY